MNPPLWRRPAGLALGSAGLILVFFVLREHWGHALGVLPYALLLACPLMHFFHHGHHGHADEGSSPASASPPTPAVAP